MIRIRTGQNRSNELLKFWPEDLRHDDNCEKLRE